MLTVTPTASTAPLGPATPPTLPAASIEPARRYQVQSVLWGNRKRFVVRDTATDTTVAIRTTSQIADSDLMRLNMAARTDYGPRLDARPVHADPASAPRDRQSGRCRQFSSADPARQTTALEDWWLCEPCRDKLLGDHHTGSK
jgi:hypothetical protein